MAAEQATATFLLQVLDFTKQSDLDTPWLEKATVTTDKQKHLVEAAVIDKEFANANIITNIARCSQVQYTAASCELEVQTAGKQEYRIITSFKPENSTTTVRY